MGTEFYLCDCMIDLFDVTHTHKIDQNRMNGSKQVFVMIGQVSWFYHGILMEVVYLTVPEVCKV